MLTPRDKCVVVAVDFQEKLLPTIENCSGILSAARLILDAAAQFNVSTVFTEHIPEKLGSTVCDLHPGAAPVIAKTRFNACAGLAQQGWLSDEFDNVVLMGCEAHICVLQTAVGLLERGKNVFLVADAIGAARETDKDAAVARLRTRGAEIVTSEMVVFEWLGDGASERFKRLLPSVKAARKNRGGG